MAEVGALVLKLRALRILGVPSRDQVGALLQENTPVMDVVRAGLELADALNARLAWTRSCLDPVGMGSSASWSPTWEADLEALGLHPLSLLLTSRTQTEASAWQRRMRRHRLSGRIRVLVQRPLMPFWKEECSSLVYEGRGQELDLPAGLVVDQDLTLRDWRVAGGLPDRLQAGRITLALDRCRGDLTFPAGFNLRGGLKASRCQGLQGLPGGGLRLAELRKCDLRSLPDAPDLGRLILKQCEHLERVGALPACTELRIESCPSLQAVGPIPNLESLEVRRMEILSWIPRGLPRLRALALIRMPGLREVGSPLPQARDLHLEQCPDLTSLAGVEEPLDTLNLWHCPRLVSLPVNLRVRSLHLNGCRLRSLSPSLGLRWLQAHDCPDLADLGLELGDFEHLSASECPCLAVPQLL